MGLYGTLPKHTTLYYAALRAEHSLTPVAPLRGVPRMYGTGIGTVPYGERLPYGTGTVPIPIPYGTVSIVYRNVLVGRNQ